MNRNWKTLFMAGNGRLATSIALRSLSNRSPDWKRIRPTWRALAIFCFLFAFPLFGQEYGSLSVVVLDATGAAVSGATVTVTQRDTDRQNTITTSDSGNYVFPSLPPAHYNVKISAQGFEIFEEPDVILAANQTVNVVAKLKVGARAETIQVESASPGTYTALDSSSATRTNTPIIDIPQSVQVINRSLIEEQDVHTLARALLNVSSVVPTTSEEILFVSPLIRGFPAEIYSDGLAMFGNTTTADDPASLVGVKRIEVLKGPNSTMYGGGLGSPLGGLINLVSERPEPNLTGYVAFRGGSFTTLDPYGDLNIPINAKIASRLAGEYQSNDTWIDLVDRERWAAQPSMSFQLGSKTDLFVQGKFNYGSQLEYSGIPAEPAMAGQIDRNAFAGAPIGQPHTTLDNRMATVELNHTFTDTLRWNTNARYYFSQAKEYGSFVFPGLNPPDPAPPVYQIYTLDMPSNPVREGNFDTNLVANLRGLGGKHELLTGVSYDHTNFYSEMGFSGIPVGEENLANPTYNLSFGPLTPINLTQTDRYQTTAVYGQDQATYGRFHLTASIRYTQLDFREREQATDKTYHHVSGRVGGTFDVAHGVALYAAWATAFRGAFGFIGQQPPKPETSQNVEGGLKLALAKAHLAGTVAIFNQTRDNVATPDPANFLYSIQTGQQRSRGADADLIWEPTRAFSLLANYAYTEASVTKDNVIPVGDTLPRVPRNSGRVAAHYRVLNGAAQGLSFGVGVTVFSSREDTLPNTVSVSGYGAVDAQSAYSFGRYTIEGSVVNLGNYHAFDTYEYFGFPVVIPNQPLSAYVTLKIQLRKE